MRRVTPPAAANLLVDSGLPGVTINTVAGDDIINAAEAGADQTISGVVTRAAAGDTVTVTLGGNTYTAQVQADLSWSVSVPAADLRALGNGDLTINASVTNANGNTGSGTRDITIDANLPGLRVDTVAGDDIVNSIEHGQALVITGGSSGLNAGVPLTITINGTAYSATVQADGSWSVGIPAANVSAACGAVKHRGNRAEQRRKPGQRQPSVHRRFNGGGNQHQHRCQRRRN